MNEIKNIEIKIDQIISIHDLVNVISSAFSPDANQQIFFKIDIKTSQHIDGEILLLIVSVVSCLKEKGFRVNGDLLYNENTDSFKYAQRIDFIKNLELQINENFTRRNSAGRFFPISKFDENNIGDIHENLLKILIRQGIDDKILVILDFCIYEILDNTLNHSSGNFKYGDGVGWVFAQYFPRLQELRICIADNGIGIHKSLTEHPKSTFANLTEEEAIRRCIENKVTNSEGRGFGLWATSEMVTQMESELEIYSGEHQLVCNQTEGKVVNEVSKWQGTITSLKLKMNKDIDIDVILGDNNARYDELEERKKEIFDELDNLW